MIPIWLKFSKNAFPRKPSAHMTVKVKVRHRKNVVMATSRHLIILMVKELNSLRQYPRAKENVQFVTRRYLNTLRLHSCMAAVVASGYRWLYWVHWRRGACHVITNVSAVAISDCSTWVKVFWRLACPYLVMYCIQSWSLWISGQAYSADANSLTNTHSGQAYSAVANSLANTLTVCAKHTCMCSMATPGVCEHAPQKIWNFALPEIEHLRAHLLVALPSNQTYTIEWIW